MDDSLVAPESRPPQNAPNPIPPVQPAPVQADPNAPQPKRPGSFQNSKAFIIIPIILIIIVIAGGSYFIANKHGASASSQSSNVPTTVAVSASTTVSSAGGSGGPSCPCLSEQQLRQALNLSAASSQHATFNLTFAQNNAAVRALIAKNRGANDTTSLPEGIMNNITEAWMETYNASANASDTEMVLKSSDINAFASYLSSQVNSSGINVSMSAVNGFHYVYFSIPIFGVNIIAIQGYKDGYIIGFGLDAPSDTVLASENAMASELGGAS